MRTVRLLVLAAVAGLAGCSLLGGTGTQPPPDDPGGPSSTGGSGLHRPGVIADGPTGPLERGPVVRVVDGDTIRVLVGGVEERVRYIGIDTPESVDPRKTIQPYALAASDANKALVEGREVVLELDVSQRDRYDRLLRYIWLDEPGGWVLVNYELVRAGFASAISYPPDVKYQDLFRQAERDARADGRGLWSDGG